MLRGNKSGCGRETYPRDERSEDWRWSGLAALRRTCASATHRRPTKGGVTHDGREDPRFQNPLAGADRTRVAGPTLARSGRTSAGIRHRPATAWGNDIERGGVGSTA